MSELIEIMDRFGKKLKDPIITVADTIPKIRSQFIGHRTLLMIMGEQDKWCKKLAQTLLDGAEQMAGALSAYKAQFAILYDNTAHFDEIARIFNPESVPTSYLLDEAIHTKAIIKGAGEIKRYISEMRKAYRH